MGRGAQRIPTGIKHISTAFAGSMPEVQGRSRQGQAQRFLPWWHQWQHRTKMRGVPRWRSYRSGTTYSFVAWALGEKAAGRRQMDGVSAERPETEVFTLQQLSLWDFFAKWAEQKAEVRFLPFQCDEDRKWQNLNTDQIGLKALLDRETTVKMQQSRGLLKSKWVVIWVCEWVESDYFEALGGQQCSVCMNLLPTSCLQHHTGGRTPEQVMLLRGSIRFNLDAEICDNTWRNKSEGAKCWSHSCCQQLELLNTSIKVLLGNYF